jgi:hypothetical protein
MLALVEERMLQSYPQKHDLGHKCPSLAIENNGFIFFFSPWALQGSDQYF